jgi:hypothetical protein
MFQLVGGDVSLPLINGKVVRLDLYGQAASRVDKVRGWGFGAPGLDLKAGPVWARAEYRHVQGLFQPGFFGTYYLDERLERYPVVHTKLDSLSDLNLNGVFGILGVNIAEVLIVTGTYQYLVGPTDKGDTLRDKRTDQRYEATAGIGKKITDHIPKFKKLEGYISKSNVKAEPKYNTDGSIRTTGTGSDAKVVYDDFFDKTPYLYWGYRIGFEITKGASLVWDSRHGYRYKSRTDKRLGDNNTMSIQTVITF